MSARDPEADSTVDVSAAAQGAKLLLAVRQWLEQDPEQATRDELTRLLERAQDPSAAEKEAGAAVAELAERFSGTLQFGTAGLRAALGAGPMRMNRAVVRRAAAGVAAYAQDRVRELDPQGEAARAVIGFDARHGSADFARDTAAALTASGLTVEVMPRPLPTPLLAWAVRERGAEVGVMVTASHNPAADNGYKVYLGGRIVEESGRGCQIVPPHDVEIARRIEAVEDLRELELAESGWETLPQDIEQQYLAAILPSSATSSASTESAESTADGAASEATAVRIVLTEMHGVGGAVALEALARAGFEDVHPVPEQIEPDPDFPTAAFPNPEEPGALDLAMALARRVEADLILAHDPDADRCAVAVPDPQDPRSVDGWRMLTGDEVGALLGLAALRRLGESSAAEETASGSAPVLASSIVSSRLLGRMAAAAGIEHRETLTGFKWIARVPGLAYGYEEALGYCVAPDVVRDKDGISAGLEIARLARAAAGRGTDLVQELDALMLAHGLHATSQLSIRVSDLEQIPRMMTVLREQTPQELAGSKVVGVQDLLHPDPDSELLPTEGLRLLTDDGGRVIVRPSGTEPKLKCYLEAVLEVPSDQDLPRVRDAAQTRLTAIADQLRELLTG